MGRRDFLVVWLQTLLLAFFPWLRTERGIEVAGQVAEAWVPQIVDQAIFKGGMFNISMVIKGYELAPDHLERLMKALTDVGEPGVEVKT